MENKSSRLITRQTYAENLTFAGTAPGGIRDCHYIFIEKSASHLDKHPSELSISISYKIAGTDVTEIQFPVPDKCKPVSEILDFTYSKGEATIENGMGMMLKPALIIKFKRPINLEKFSFRIIYK